MNARDGMAGSDHPARWWHRLDDGRVQCDLCPRDCKLHEGQRGFCFVRQSLGGADGARPPTAAARGFCIDPIEKKPLNHFFPGTAGALVRHRRLQPGLQVLPELGHLASAREIDRPDRRRVARGHRRGGAASTAAGAWPSPTTTRSSGPSTPSTPPEACRARGIKTVAVTAGLHHAEPRREFYDAMDAANVDLKGFTEEFYRTADAARTWQPVLDTLRWLRRETDVLARDHQPDDPRAQRLDGRDRAHVRAGSPTSWGRTCRCTSRPSIPTSR